MDGAGADAGAARWAGPPDDPDRYRLDHLHSEGGEGQLWRGSITVDGWDIPVAVKVIHPRHLAERDEWRRRWRRQAELLRSLDHPALVKVRDLFEGAPPHAAGEPPDPAAGPVLYLVMNWVPGLPLDRWAAGPPRVPPARVVAVIERAAAALDHLHGGHDTGGRPVLHRDVKPANVLVDGDAVKLVDFGFARLEDGTSMTFAGTPSYLAPEVLGGAAFSPASDRYALGATAFAALTGRTADPSDRAGMDASLRAVPAREPPALAREVLAMMDPDPARRPRSAATWAALLRVAVGDEEAAAPPPAFDVTVLDPPAALMTEISSVRRGGGHPSTPPPLPPPPRVGRRLARVLVAAAAAAAVAVGATIATRGGEATVRSVVVGGVPADVGVDDRSAWVADSGGSLVRVDTRALDVLGRVPAGASPTDVATGEGAAWVVSRPDGTLAKVDGVSGRVVATVAGLGDPVGVAVGGGAVFVADAEGRRVVVVDAARATVLHTVPVDGRPQDVVVGQGGAWVVTTDGLLARLDLGSRQVAASARLGGELFDVAPGNGSVWVVRADAGELLRVDPVTLEVEDRLAVGGRPVAVSLGLGSVWVALFDAGRVVQVDAGTGEEVRSVRACAGPNGLNVGAGALWVACRRDGRLVRIDG